MEEDGRGGKRMEEEGAVGSAPWAQSTWDSDKGGRRKEGRRKEERMDESCYQCFFHEKRMA